MKLNLILLTTIFWAGIISAQNNISFTEEDKDILFEIFEKIDDAQNKPVNEIVVLAGQLLLKTPYAANTLERDKEQLVINLRELDCTTFAENCLSIARCIKSGNKTFDEFASQLQKIRYRNGIINGYPSRLHYFSDWIFENNKNTIIKDVSESVSSIPYPIEVNFMSTHPSSYTQLDGNELNIKTIQEKEEEICTRKMYYIPKGNIRLFEPKLSDGDIIGITTSIKGLDISHVGILIHKNGRIYLMHASSKAKKVIVSENVLEEYLNESTTATGIMVARPI